MQIHFILRLEKNMVDSYPHKNELDITNGETP